MKRIVFFLIFSMMSLMTLNAQCRKYQGEFLLGGMIGLNRDYGSRIDISTTQGVIFDGKTFVGAGVGVNSDFAGSFEIPLYGKFSQLFHLSNTLALAIGTSTGICMNQNEDLSLYLAPEISFQISSVSFFLKYSYRNYLQGVTGGDEWIYDTCKSHCLGAGIGIVFGGR